MITGEQLIILIFALYCLYVIYTIITAVQWHFKYRKFIDKKTLDQNIEIWNHDPKAGNGIALMGFLSVGSFWGAYGKFPLFLAVFVAIGYMATGYKYALSPLDKAFRYNPELAKKKFGDGNNGRDRERIKYKWLKEEINRTAVDFSIRKWHIKSLAIFTLYPLYLIFFASHNAEMRAWSSPLDAIVKIGEAILITVLLYVIFFYILRLISHIKKDQGDIFKFNIPVKPTSGFNYSKNKNTSGAGSRPNDRKSQKEQTKSPPPSDDAFAFREEKFKEDRFSDTRFSDTRAKNKYRGRYKAAHNPSTPENEAFQNLKWLRQADEGKQKGIKPWSDKD